MSVEPEYVVITTTCDQADKAQQLARMLVERRLAACVQSTPVDSIYRWRGKIETAREILLAVKTRRGLASDVEEAIRSIHPYEEPEIVVCPILGGSESYLAWVAQQTEPANAHRPVGDDT